MKKIILSITLLFVLTACTTMKTTQIETTQAGKGPKTENGNQLVMHYTGMLEDGTVFDSSLTRNQPFSFVLGGGQVIKGWEVGTLGMQAGEKRKLTIPYGEAYGEGGIPGTIPAKATLIFEIELLDIK